MARTKSGSSERSRLRQTSLWLFKAVLPFAALAVLWQVATLFFPAFLFPNLLHIIRDVGQIFISWDLLSAALVTWGRLIFAVAVSLVIGIPIGLAMGLSRGVDDFVRPIVKFIMGVPALNWVIIVVIWFGNVELRISFVLVMLCVPITVFCVYDGVRSIDRKLTDMVLSFGAPSGIGRELDLAKNLFDMPMVLAWTLLMVTMGFIMSFGIEQAERAVLRWRGGDHARE